MFDFAMCCTNCTSGTDMFASVVRALGVVFYKLCE